MPSVIVAEHQHGQISSFCTCEELLDGGGPDWEKYRAFEDFNNFWSTMLVWSFQSLLDF